MNETEKDILKECEEAHTANTILKDAKEKTNDAFYDCILTKDEYTIILKVANNYYKLLDVLYGKIAFLATLTNIEKNPELKGQAKLIEEISKELDA